MKIPYQTGQGVLPTGGSTTNIDMTAINTQKNIFDSVMEAGQTVYDINADAVASEHTVAAKLRLHELTASFSSRTDYQTFGSDFETASDSIYAELSQNIDPRLLPDFKANFQNAKLTNFTKVTSLALAGVQDKAKASLDNNITTIEIMDGRPDITDKQRQTNEVLVTTLLETAVSNKVITAEKAQEELTQYKSNRAKNSIRKIISAHPEAALAVLNNENVYSVKNNETGEIEFVPESDLTPTERKNLEPIVFEDEKFLTEADRTSLLRRAEIAYNSELRRRNAQDDRQVKLEKREKDKLQDNNYASMLTKIDKSTEGIISDEGEDIVVEKQYDTAFNSITAFQIKYSEIDEEITALASTQAITSAHETLLRNRLDNKLVQEELEYVVSIENAINSNDYTSSDLERDATPLGKYTSDGQEGTGLISNVSTYNRLRGLLKTNEETPLRGEDKLNLDFVKDAFNVVKTEEKLYGGFESAKWARMFSELTMEFHNRVRGLDPKTGLPDPDRKKENSRVVALELRERFWKYFEDTATNPDTPPFAIPKELTGTNQGTIDFPAFKRMLSDRKDQGTPVATLVKWIRFAQTIKLAEDDKRMLKEFKEQVSPTQEAVE